MKIAILGSTRGTDLQAIIYAIENDILKDVEISFVLSNVEDAFILERARKHNIKDIFLNPKGKKRVTYDNKITELLEEHGVELILLIGYMKLMSKEFVNRWKNKVMNIHPSLLPAFAGGIDLNVHDAVIKKGCKITGASLIFIDEGADTGPIISQEIVKVDKNDTPETLKRKVQQVEQKLLVEALANYRDKKIKVVDGKVLTDNKCNKIYLAGKFSDKKFIKDHMIKLEDIGYEIIHDWTSFEKAGDDENKLTEAAILDIDSVKKSDVLVAMLTDPKYAYRGTFTEIGCALGIEMPVVILCPDEDSYCKSNCFFHHPNIIHVKNWDELLIALKSLLF